MGRHERTQRVGGTHSVRSFPNHSLDDPHRRGAPGPPVEPRAQGVRVLPPGALDSHRAHPCSLDELRAVGLRIGVLSHNRADDWEHFDVDEITAMNGRIEHSLGPSTCGACAWWPTTGPAPAPGRQLRRARHGCPGAGHRPALRAGSHRRPTPGRGGGREEVANLFAELDGVEASPDERVTMEAGALGRAAEWIVLESSLRPDGQFRNTPV